MGNIFSFVIAALLLYDAYLCFCDNSKLLKRIQGKYTTESIAKYSKILACGFIFSALVFAGIGLVETKVITFGDETDSIAKIVAYSVAIVVVVVIEIIGRKAILKKLDTYTEPDSKKGKEEEEDF